MGQYYAQPQNGFWRIMGAIFGAGPSLPYPERLERLIANRVAVWDVLAAGERNGTSASVYESRERVGAVYRQARELVGWARRSIKAAEIGVPLQRSPA